MLIPHFIVSIFSIGLMVVGAGVVYGQDYPKRPIRIVTSASGGVNDFTARIIAPGLSDALGQPVVVENRGGIMAPEVVAIGTPDGHTLLLNTDNIWLAPLIRKTSYDPVRDFAPISLLISAPLILAVHPSVAVKSVKELIALAKAKPGALNYGMSTMGSANHLSVELFKAMTGVNIVQISYKGSGPLVIGLLGGEVQVAIDTGASLLPHIKSGKLRALAVTSAKPSALFPDLPVVAATVPGYAHGLLSGMFAPARTPAAIISRLNQEIVQVLNQADIKEKFSDRGIEIVGNSPEGFAATVKSDIARIGKLIKDAGIKTE